MPQSTFVSRHPIVAIVTMAVGFAGGAGVVAFGYITVLSSQGLAPRSDALAIMAVITGLLLTSGVVVVYVRQSTALENGLATLEEQSTLRSGELEALQKQTASLESGVNVLVEQQRALRALYTPAPEIDRLRTTDRSSAADVIRFDVTNPSFGEAINCTVRSEIELIGAPDGYSVSGGRAICPLTRADRWQRSPRVPAHADELSFETNVLVDVSESILENNQKHTVTCRLSDAMRVLYEDDVDAVELSFEFVYEDIFGDEYTEQLQLSRIDLTDETTVDDVFRSDSQSVSGGSVESWFQDPKTTPLANK